MKYWTVLYAKELKDNINAFVLLWVATIGVGGYAMSLQGEALILGSGLALLPYGAVLVMPFLLAQSFAGESKGHTNYLLLSLPVPAWQIGLSKVAAILSAGLGVFALATSAFQWISGAVAELGFLNGAQLQGVDIWVLGGLGYHAFALLLLGIACIMEGIKQALKHHRRLAALGTFIGCFWLYFKCSDIVLASLGDWGLYSIEIQMMQPMAPTEVNMGWLLYTGALGLIFIALGLGLYGRFAEVD